MGKKADASSTVLVIFGITGDLAKRKLLPALAALESEGLLPANLQIIGISRRSVKVNSVLGKKCGKLSRYVRMLQIDMGSQTDYQKIKETLPSAAHTLFYLAIPPAAVLPVVRCLGAAKLNGPNVKLLLEKPFGTDLPSAKKLITQINSCFSERQVYRIDHYLAKEAAQNIAVFLGSNAVFREVWNKNFIEKIEIYASEKIGIEGRADFWESTGTLRDFVQSHILQLAALVLMEPCDDFADVERLPALRLAALQQLTVHPSHVHRGQYDSYRKESGNPKSVAETFVALQAGSTDARWAGVPIIMATGKRLKTKHTQIIVTFKQVSASKSNVLALNIQPREGIKFYMWVKEPGHKHRLQKLPLSFEYGRHFKRLPDAYEQVVLDALSSNRSLFASGQEVLASWQVLQPVLDTWQKSSRDLFTYESGTSLEKLVQKLLHS